MAASSHLLAEGETPSQARLAEVTNFDKMMVSKALRLLESKGFLRRSRHPDDPRAKRIELTPRGKTALAKARRLASHALDEFFGILGKRRQVLSDLLQELLQDEDGDC